MDETEMMYAEDAAPWRDLRAVIRGGCENGLTETDYGLQLIGLIRMHSFGRYVP